MQAIIDFVLELDKLKAVTRKTRPLGQSRQENSAEHSWQVALLAWALAPHAAPGIDLARVVAMLLVHDIGEIDTGDTLVYVDTGAAERREAEAAAVRRIAGLLPPAQADQLVALWQEFDAAQTPEARLAHAADRAMPVLLNLANHGQSWRENGIDHARVVARIAAPIRAGCPALWEALAQRLAEAEAAGWYGARPAAAVGSTGTADPAAVVVRPITLADVPAFRACLDAVARERRWLALTEALPLPRMEAFVRENVDTDAVQFVAVQGDAVVGWADVLTHWAPSLAHCGSLGMGLLPAYRGQGLGRRLLQACIDKGWQRGIDRIVLEARADNHRAIRLYEHMGFVHEGLRRRAMRIDGTDHDTVAMALLKPGP